MKLEYELLINFSNTHLSLKIGRFFCQGHSTIMKYLQMIIWLHYIYSGQIESLKNWVWVILYPSLHSQRMSLVSLDDVKFSSSSSLSLMYRFYAICLFTVLYPPKLLYNFNYFSGKLGVIIHKNEIVVEIFFRKWERTIEDDFCLHKGTSLYSKNVFENIKCR